MDEKLQTLLNAQINNEHGAALIYTQLAYEMDNLSFPGMRDWFFKQAEEEREHAQKSAEHLLEADEEMVNLVLRFIGEGHSVGILSNVPAALGAKVRASQPWLEECAAVTLSCDIGVAKPDPEAYHVAVDALGAQAKDTYFFDDRLDFVEGAQRVGLHAQLFTGIDSVRF